MKHLIEKSESKIISLDTWISCDLSYDIPRVGEDQLREEYRRLVERKSSLPSDW